MKRPRHTESEVGTMPKPPKDQEARPETPPENDITQPPPDMEITEDEANIFCFGVFADKNTGVVYNDLTGKFPFMSLDGNVCFFVMYHYKSNAILVKPVSNLDDESIFEAYKCHVHKLN